MVSAPLGLDLAIQAEQNGRFNFLDIPKYVIGLVYFTERPHYLKEEDDSMKVANNLLELIGSTPMVRLNKVIDDCQAAILVKLEYYNPSGSVKDRIALYMLEEARRRGDTLWRNCSRNSGRRTYRSC